MDFKAMRKAAGMTLKQAAQLSGYTVGAINGEELHSNGSDRLRAKLAEVYGFCNPIGIRQDSPGNVENDLESWKIRALSAEAELAALKKKLAGLL